MLFAVTTWRRRPAQTSVNSQKHGQRESTSKLLLTSRLARDFLSAGVAELVDAGDSKSPEAQPHEGSNPSSGTMFSRGYKSSLSIPQCRNQLIVSKLC